MPTPGNPGPWPSLYRGPISGGEETEPATADIVEQVIQSTTAEEAAIKVVAAETDDLTAKLEAQARQIADLQEALNWKADKHHYHDDYAGANTVADHETRLAALETVNAAVVETKTTETTEAIEVVAATPAPVAPAPARGRGRRRRQ